MCLLQVLNFCQQSDWIVAYVPSSKFLFENTVLLNSVNVLCGWSLVHISLVLEQGGLTKWNTYAWLFKLVTELRKRGLPTKSVFLDSARLVAGLKQTALTKSIHIP